LIDMPVASNDAELGAALAASSNARHKLERLMELLTTDGHHGTGASPAEIVHSENKLRLLRMVDDQGRPFNGPPVLFVSAPVSRYFVLDLLPGRSFTGHVAEAGFDVFLIDFGQPTKEDRFADLDYYVNGLVGRCVRRVLTLTGQSQTGLVGYCLGGTLSLLYTVLQPENVAGLVLVTTTVDGDVHGGIAWTAHCMGLEGESYDNPRLVPAEEVKSWFEMLAPGSNSLAGRVSGLWAQLDQPIDRLRDVRAMASWVDDVVPASGRLLAEMYQKFGPGSNGLLRGTADVAGEKLDMSRLSMPLLSVSAAKDTIAPPDGVDAITQIVPHAEVVRLPGGHVGIVAGRSAITLWDITSKFLRVAMTRSGS